MFLAQVSNALQEETVPDADGKESTRIVMKLHPAIAPVKVCRSSTVEKQRRIDQGSRDVFNTLKIAFQLSI